MTVDPVSLGAAREALNTLHCFYRVVDQGQARRAVEFVTDDVDMILAGEPVVGRQAMQEFLARREQQKDLHTAHVLANEVVSVGDDGAVTVDSTLLIHRRPEGAAIMLSVVYDAHHVLRAGHDRWRLAFRRTTELLGSG